MGKKVYWSKIYYQKTESQLKHFQKVGDYLHSLMKLPYPNADPNMGNISQTYMVPKVKSIYHRTKCLVFLSSLYLWGTLNFVRIHPETITSNIVTFVTFMLHFCCNIYVQYEGSCVSSRKVRLWTVVIWYRTELLHKLERDKQSVVHLRRLGPGWIDPSYATHRGYPS